MLPYMLTSSPSVGMGALSRAPTPSANRHAEGDIRREEVSTRLISPVTTLCMIGWRHDPAPGIEHPGEFPPRVSRSTSRFGPEMFTVLRISLGPDAGCARSRSRELSSRALVRRPPEHPSHHLPHS